jgi:hypothetical protein
MIKIIGGNLKNRWSENRGKKQKRVCCFVRKIETGKQWFFRDGYFCNIRKNVNI